MFCCWTVGYLPSTISPCDGQRGEDQGDSTVRTWKNARVLKAAPQGFTKPVDLALMALHEPPVSNQNLRVLFCNPDHRQLGKNERQMCAVFISGWDGINLLSCSCSAGANSRWNPWHWHLWLSYNAPCQNDNLSIKLKKQGGRWPRLINLQLDWLTAWLHLKLSNYEVSLGYKFRIGLLTNYIFSFNPANVCTSDTEPIRKALGQMRKLRKCEAWLIFICSTTHHQPHWFLSAWRNLQRQV